MDYYKLSEEPLQSAKINKDQGLYRMSVCMSTLAIDVLLKSVLFRIAPDNNLLMGHNHHGMIIKIESKYPPNENIRHIAKLSRKYFKDSRYSNTETLSVFTENLASDFIGYAECIKDYVDSDCKATIDDLQKRFG
ncbi:MAG: HEPN domain-containing protein [Defluviitaleaceae bacterium]|nr:HEPN domain-containing protein [Defluviitaleaceae bacterium]